jgi:hypothetical protein
MIIRVKVSPNFKRGRLTPNAFSSLNGYTISTDLSNLNLNPKKLDIKIVKISYYL